MDYILHIGILISIYSLLALSINLMLGYTGLLSMMQAVFYGIGAYSIAVFTNEKIGWSFLPSLLMGFAINLGLSYLVSLLSNRLRDLYFGLATLAIQIIFYSIAYNWVDVTNGSYGISGISMNILGWEINGNLTFFAISTIITILAYFFLKWLEQTPLCRMMKSVRDDQLAVVALGKNPAYYKLLSICIASILATLAGAIYATYISYIDPSSFTLDESILLLCILLVGGSGNLVGPIAGAIFYTLLPEILRLIQLPDSIAANIKVMLFGLILILIVRFRPNGFIGTYSLGK